MLAFPDTMMTASDPGDHRQAVLDDEATDSGRRNGDPSGLTRLTARTRMAWVDRGDHSGRARLDAARDRMLGMAGRFRVLCNVESPDWSTGGTRHANADQDELHGAVPQ